MQKGTAGGTIQLGQYYRIRRKLGKDSKELKQERTECNTLRKETMQKQ
jgi:hypothetical protein